MTSHQHEYTTDYRGVAVCFCGDEQERTGWVVRDEDLVRWSGIKAKMLNALKFGKPISRSVLERIAGGSINPATRMSELRKIGYVIDCTRDGTETFYQITEFNGKDNTKATHCATCTCERAE